MLSEFILRYPALAPLKEKIEDAAIRMIGGFENGKKLLLCGNGGSCADCEHIVGELMKGFLLKRPLTAQVKEQMKQNVPFLSDACLSHLQGALPAISLTSFAALNSAFCNDVNADLVYAQALMGLGSEGDILLAISTSGNSKNVFNAAVIAKARGMTVIGLTGASGGMLKALCDVCLSVPETETYRVQELHLPIYHYLCARIESAFFAE